DDLEAVTGLRDRAHHVLDRVQRLAVRLRAVMQLEAQAGRAVGQALDVLGPADAADDVLGDRRGPWGGAAHERPRPPFVLWSGRDCGSGRCVRATKKTRGPAGCVMAHGMIPGLAPPR